MRSILAPEARAALDGLARTRALLAFDFDGTLAPIVADREAAELPTETRRLLRALALLYPCAVISGRSRADVARRLDGLPLLGVVGNHGAEAGFGPRDRSYRELLLGWRRELNAAVGDLPGVDVEDKRFSLAVHYRHAPQRAEARRRALHAAAALPGARVFGGHAVVNVAPVDAPDKGTALEELLGRIGPRPVLYVGDDRTDEDVFRAECVTVGVRVGRTFRSAARWYLPHQGSIDALLSALIEARTDVDGLRERATALARVVG